MPLYEYLCSACAHHFERIRKFSDAPLRTCPNCGRDTVKQVISAPAVQFKGSGWYVTDYAKKNSAASGSASSSKAESSAPEATSSSPSSAAGGDSSAAPATSSGTLAAGADAK